MEVKLKFLKDDECKVVKELFYHQLVGRLIYLTTTRPNITFAVGMLSRFLNCPIETHWNATKRVLRYIKDTSNFGIVLEKDDNLILKGFLYANRASDTNETKSTRSYAFTFCSGVITWASTKQPSVVISTIEA
jgi:hypothetical protein